MMTSKTSCTISNVNTNFEHLRKVGTFKFKVNDHYPSTKTRTNCRKKKKKKKIMKIDFIFVKITSIMKSDWKLCC